jgi:citrate synthase
MAPAKKSAAKTVAAPADVAAPTVAPTFKPKKSVALSGVTAGNTALCTVGRSGNDLHYRGYDVLDFADTSEFEEIAHLLIHGKLPNKAELTAYKDKLRSLRGLPAQLQTSGCQPSHGCHAHSRLSAWLHAARKRRSQHTRRARYRRSFNGQSWVSTALLVSL